MSTTVVSITTTRVLRQKKWPVAKVVGNGGIWTARTTQQYGRGGGRRGPPSSPSQEPATRSYSSSSSSSPSLALVRRRYSRYDIPSATTTATVRSRMHHNTAAMKMEDYDDDEDDDDDDFNIKGGGGNKMVDAAEAQNKDYFHVFDLAPPTFRLDLTDLKRRYHKLMTEHHPDKQQHQIDDKDLLVSANDVTHAYQTLVQPHTRATHLLELYHNPLLEHDENDNQLVGMCFLMDVLEWRERIEELDDDVLEGQQQQARLASIWTQTQSRKKECLTNLEDVFDRLASSLVNDDDDDDDDDNDESEQALLQEARKYTAQLQYWHRLETTLRERMDVT